MDFQAQRQQALAILHWGLFFGLSMAVYSAHGRKKYRLPNWASLGQH